MKRKLKATAIGLFGIASTVALLHTVGVAASAILPTSPPPPAIFVGFFAVMIFGSLCALSWLIGDEVLRRTGEKR